METAEIVARECGLPLEQLDELREWTLPPVHGLSPAEIAMYERAAAKEKLLTDERVDLPGFESLQEAGDRTATAAHSLFPAPGQITLIVGHGRAHNSFCNNVFGLPSAGSPRLSLNFGRLSCFWRQQPTPLTQAIELVAFNVPANDLADLMCDAD
jgi:broad specificity phosphatase PhoE